MPTEIKTKLGTASVWANTSDYSSTVSGLARTNQLDLTSLAAGAARQGTKGDLGATQPARYLVRVAFEFAVAPTSGEVVDVYWAGSPSSTAGSANPGGASGADSAYAPAGDSLDDWLKQQLYLGSLVAAAVATTNVQYQDIATVSAEELGRYGMPIVDNNTSQNLVADAVEQYVAFIPIIDESQ